MCYKIDIDGAQEFERRFDLVDDVYIAMLDLKPHNFFSLTLGC